MAWFTALIGFLEGLLKAVPFLDKWFTKTPTEKVDDRKEDLDEREREFREGKRPKW